MDGACEDKVGERVDSCKIVYLLPTHLFRHFCCRMYPLATMHSVTDGRIDGQTDDFITTIADHTACSSAIDKKN